MPATSTATAAAAVVLLFCGATCPAATTAAGRVVNATKRAAAFQAKYGQSRGCGQPPPYNPTNPGQSLYQEDVIDGLERGWVLHLPTTV